MRNSILVVCATVFLASLLGCSSKASEQEVDRMCRNLTELRKAKQGDSAQTDIDAEIKKCKADPIVADVSPKTAACRIAAKDVDTFWNKCR